MNEIIQAVKDVWATMVSLGYQPAPVFIAFAAMLAARSYFEPSAIQVNTVEALKAAGRVKIYIFIAVIFTNGLIQVGLAKPANPFDWCLSFGFAIGNSMVAYVLSSSAIVRNFLKDSLFKGGSNAPNPPAV